MRKRRKNAEAEALPEVSRVEVEEVGSLVEEEHQSLFSYSLW